MPALCSPSILLLHVKAVHERPRLITLSTGVGRLRTLNIETKVTLLLPRQQHVGGASAPPAGGLCGTGRCHRELFETHTLLLQLLYLLLRSVSTGTVVAVAIVEVSSPPSILYSSSLHLTLTRKNRRPTKGICLSESLVADSAPRLFFGLKEKCV